MPTADPSLQFAQAVIRRTQAGAAPNPVVATFFDEATFTASHVVHDPNTRAAAIIDSVADFDAAAGVVSYASADGIAAYVRQLGLQVAWLLETHIHADHLSAVPHLKAQLGGQTAIGAGVTQVQDHFGSIFNLGGGFARDGSEFDRLLADGERLLLGELEIVALATPGHTAADVAFVVGDAVFVGDTLFLPDSGTARADFPGGDAGQLYRSIRRLLSLPDETRIFVCHDYQAPGRSEFAWQTTVAAQRAANVHVRDGVGEAEFVALRTGRDRTLSAPRLILPSIQVNMRGGHLPEAEDNGARYLKIPLTLADGHA